MKFLGKGRKTGMHILQHTLSSVVLHIIYGLRINAKPDFSPSRLNWRTRHGRQDGTDKCKKWRHEELRIL
jgi:hypothetical protein